MNGLLFAAGFLTALMCVVIAAVILLSLPDPAQDRGRAGQGPAILQPDQRARESGRIW